MFGVVVLSVLRIPKSLMASPLGVDMDTHEVTFTNGTYFRQVRGAGWALCSVWCSVLCTLCQAAFLMVQLPPRCLMLAGGS